MIKILLCGFCTLVGVISIAVICVALQNHNRTKFYKDVNDKCERMKKWK